MNVLSVLDRRSTRRRLVFGVVAVLLGLLALGVFLDAHSLHTAAERAKLASDFATAAAVVVGGVWALFTFVIFRSDVGHVALHVGLRVVRYSSTKAVLLVRVTVKNSSSIRVRPRTDGFTAKIWALPLDSSAGEALRLEPSGAALVVDFLAPYDPTVPYELEPGVEYHETAAVVAALGELLAVRATFSGVEEADQVSEAAVIRIEPAAATESSLVSEA